MEATDYLAIIAIIISCISLFLYTQREKKPYLRLMANSNRYDFSIDLENVGSGLAKIKDIKIKKLNTIHGEVPELAKYLNIIMQDEQVSKTPEKSDNTVRYTKRLYSNPKGDVIVGGGVKHHLFRCTVKDFMSLQNLWEEIRYYEIEVEYENVYGPKTNNEPCISHFEKDYQTFIAAIGNRNGFIVEKSSGDLSKKNEKPEGSIIADPEK